MRNLLEDLDPKGKTIEILAEDDGDVVWTKWVEPSLEKADKAPGTLISYLTSLQKFYRFLTSRKHMLKSMPALDPSHEKTYGQVLTALKGWRANINSRTQDRQAERYLDECDDILTEEEVNKLKISEPYINGLRAFALARKGALLSAQQFSEARDLLIVRLTLATGTRPGPLENMTLKQYERAKTMDGNKIILVTKHKRSADGPAMVGLNVENDELMATFIDKIRSHFALEGEERVFVKQDGERFNEGTIGKRLSAFFTKSGVAMGKRVAHTSIRKFISTKTHEHAPESSEVVAKVMSHSRQTAKRSYVRSELTEVGTSAMAVIAKVTGTKRTHGVSLSELVPGTPKKGRQSVIEITQPVPLQEVQHTPSTSYMSACSDQQSVTSKVSKWLNTTSSLDSARRRHWSEEDTNALSLPFIGTKLVPTKQEIVSICENDQELSEILEREGTSRVYEKVKSIFRSRSKKR